MLGAIFCNMYQINQINPIFWGTNPGPPPGSSCPKYWIYLIYWIRIAQNGPQHWNLWIYLVFLMCA